MQILEDNNRPTSIQDVIACALEILGTIAAEVTVEEMEDPHICHNPEKCNLPDYTDALALLEEKYLFFLDKFNTKISYNICEELSSLMTALILWKRKTEPEKPFSHYLKTRKSLLDILYDEACDEHTKVFIINNLIALAQYDLPILQALRDWGEKFQNQVWVKRCLAYEITTFKNGQYATQEENTLRQKFTPNGMHGALRFYPPLSATMHKLTKTIK